MKIKREIQAVRLTATGRMLVNYINPIISDETEFHRRMFEKLATALSIMVIDAKGRVVFASEHFMRQLGITFEDVHGKTAADLVAAGFYEKSAGEIALKSGKDVKTFIYDADNAPVYSESVILTDDSGAPEYVLTHSTLPKSVAREIEKLRRELSFYKNESQHLRGYLLKGGNQIVCESAEMSKLLTNVVKAAPTNSSVLLTGESGVGKEVIAKVIHNCSNRADMPFVPICVPLLPPSLIEAELYGYVDGAFTSAQKAGKAGFFEVANGGTVFLDEIGDIALDTQVKLLRILENREVTRTGSTKPIKLDIRVVSATNKDLKAMIREGTFREDLYYRLGVIEFHISSLRHRRADIIPLVNHFVANFNSNYGANKTIALSAMDEMERFDWPGNVRQLRNIVEKILVLSESDYISPAHVKEVLSEENRHAVAQPAISAAVVRHPPSSGAEPEGEYEEVDRRKVFDALVRAKGNRSKAAKMLGISRSRLYRRIDAIRNEGGTLPPPHILP